MARTKEYSVRILLPLTPKLAERINEARAPGEDRTAFIREAVEREIKRRARLKP